MCFLCYITQLIIILIIKLSHLNIFTELVETRVRQLKFPERIMRIEGLENLTFIGHIEGWKDKKGNSE